MKNVVLASILHNLPVVIYLFVPAQEAPLSPLKGKTERENAFVPRPNASPKDSFWRGFSRAGKILNTYIGGTGNLFHFDAGKLKKVILASI